MAEFPPNRKRSSPGPADLHHYAVKSVCLSPTIGQNSAQIEDRNTSVSAADEKSVNNNETNNNTSVSAAEERNVNNNETNNNTSVSAADEKTVNRIDASKNTSVSAADSHQSSSSDDSTIQRQTQLREMTGLKGDNTDVIYVKWGIEVDTESVEDPNNANSLPSTTKDEEEVEESEDVWWKGVLKAPSTIVSTPSGKFVWTIHYEGYKTFPPEVCRVLFESCRSLRDLDHGGASMKFRVEGEEDDDNCEEDIIRASEIIAAQESVDFEDSAIGLGTADEVLSQTISSLPHEHQVHVALAYRTFADTLQNFFKEKIAENEEYVMTKEDIQEFCEFHLPKDKTFLFDHKDKGK